MEEFTVLVDIVQEELSDGSPIWVATSRGLDLSSQGSSVEEAQRNFTEALDLFLETASQSEIRERVQLRPSRTFTTMQKVMLPVGQTENLIGAGCL